MGWAQVEFKLEQANRALERLSTAKSRQDFYDGLTFFLSTARSVVSVLAFQYGFREFASGERAAGTNRHLALSTAEQTKRDQFDVWLQGAATPVLAHPLKADRDADVHREGVSSAKFRLPAGAGLLLETGGPTEPLLVIRKNSLGQVVIGLPLEGPRPQDFYFQFDTTSPALTICGDYLAAIKNLVDAAKTRV